MMRKLLVIGVLVFAALLGSATFLDLRIDKALFNPQSDFGALFATLAMIPLDAIPVIVPAMVWAVLVAKRKAVKPIGALVLFLLSLAALALLYQDIPNFPAVLRSNLWSIVLLIIALAFAALPFAKKHPDEFLKTALIALLLLTIGRFILEIVKINWGRQRFFTMTDPDAQFTRWFLPQGKAASDGFKSFPSGHSFSAMLTVWLSLLPACILGSGAKAKQWARIIFIIALAFGFTTMFSRMVLGRHFLSDVTCGAAISLACLAAFKSLIEANYERIRTRCFKRIQP
jgi:membrane-associated phospholipid phosphatase